MAGVGKTLLELTEMLEKLEGDYREMKKKLEEILGDDEKAEVVRAIKVDMFDCREDMLALSLEISRRKQSEEAEVAEEKEEKKSGTTVSTENKVKQENTSNWFQGLLTDNNCSREYVRRDNAVWNAENRYGCKVKPPKFRRGDDFCTFLLRFEQYIIMSNIKDNLDCRLSSLVEDDATFKKLRNIRFSMDERQEVKMLIEAIKRELYPPTDARIMRATFHKMRQENGEKVEQFAQRIMDEAEKIYPDKSERDGAATTALISGVLDVEVKRRLLASSVSENFVSLTKIAVQEEHISEAIRMTPGSQEELDSHSAIPMFGLGRESGEERGTVNCQKCGRGEKCFKWISDWKKSGHFQSPRSPVNCPESEGVEDVNAVNWKHILVTGSCCDRNSYIFVDSGSAVSIVSTSFVKGVGHGLERKIRPSRLMLRSFSQDIIQVKGEIDLELTVAGTSFKHTFIVSDLLDTEFLIGDDFLRTNCITLDYGRCCLFLPGGRSAPFTEKPENVHKQIKVRCNKVTVIPPNTVQYLKGRLQAKGGSYQGVIEPRYKNGIGETGILLAHAIVHSDGKYVPIKCVNATDEPITLHKNKIVALLKPLDGHKLIKGVQVTSERTCNVRGTGIDGSSLETDPAAEDGGWTKSELFESLGLDKIEVEMTSREKERLKDIVWRYRNCFSRNEFDIGCCNMYEAKIKLKEGASPSWTYPIPTPHKLQEEMDHQIDQMVKAGVAERLSEPSDFNHPIFLVKKKSSPGKPDSWRLVADLRGTNKVCMDEKYPLPNLNHVLDTIGSDTIFSSFDLSKSFWQVPYSDDSKKITAFMHRGRSYCWARLIMGHKNSSSIFSRVMAKLLATVPIEQLIFFIDDLFLSSRTVSSHLDRLEILLRRLLQANLKLTPSKCQLLRKKVTFVGVSVGEDGIQITEDRVKDLLDLPVPTTVKRVQEVLGALNYVRKWIPNYSELARPLQILTAKGVKFVWTKECQNAFDRLKRAIADSTILAIPDTNDPFNSYHVTVDASKLGYGATLSQEIERGGRRERRIVAFFSKAVPPFKRERSQTQLEFDALVLAIEHWKMYLKNTEFKVITDCKSLLSASDSLFSKSDPALIRKCQTLANYNFSIEHVEGKRNTLCDFLSRFPFRKKFTDTACQTVNLVTREEENVVRSGGSSADDELETGNRVETSYSVLDDDTHNMSIRSSRDFVQTGEIDKGAHNRVVVVDEDERNELQILFDENQSGLVKVVKVEESEDSLCVCSIAVMPRLRKKQSNRVTFAITRDEPELQTLPDLHRIKQEQDKDPIISIVKKWVEEEKRGKIQTNRVPERLLSYWTQFNLLKIEEGMLKRKWVRKKEEECKELIVVPESCEEEIMRLFHDNITNCHPGIKSCVTKCRDYFYWPKMEKDFEMYIKACVRCGEMKQPRAYLKAPLKHLFFHHFNDAIMVDHIVPSANQRTPRGYRYILTITDAWSNYLVAVPVRSQTAKENITAIMKYWVLRFGLCRELIVDNHPGFTAQFFKEVWEAFECKKTHGTSYKSASTARAESNNKRVNQALRACIPHGKEHCWDVYLDKVTFALNCLVNRRTGHSAHKMLYGNDVNLPLNLVLDDREHHKPDERNTAAKEAYELHKEIKRVIRKVRENSELDFRYAQKHHDRNLHGPYFKQGDYCFVLVQCPKHKFAPRFRGPFEVKKVVNDHLYVVEYGPGVEKVTNICKMKHYELNKFSKARLDITKKGGNVVERYVTLPEAEKEVRESSSSSDSSSDEEWIYPRQVTQSNTRNDGARGRRDLIHIESPIARRSLYKTRSNTQPISNTPNAASNTPVISDSIARQSLASPHLITQTPDTGTMDSHSNRSPNDQLTRSSFNSSQDFYTPRRDSRNNEPMTAVEDSLSPVSLGGTSDVTMTQSPRNQSTPRTYGGRSLRNRDLLRQPDFYQGTFRIDCYDEKSMKCPERNYQATWI
ncbi:hypothetical protein ACHWQZ_G016276 [Mnemiopsis leidyi]